MSIKVSDFILQRLREWDVDHVFGYAGDGINGLLAAWGRAEDRPRFVQARHEEMAAFEAVGYAKFSGKVGVCAATASQGRSAAASAPTKPATKGPYTVRILSTSDRKRARVSSSSTEALMTFTAA